MIQEKNQIRELGIVPVIILDRAEDASELGNALLEGNLPCAEITFRTEAAEDVIRKIAVRHPDILLGAGTVLSVDQAERAVGVGARFIVSPGMNSRIVTWCLKKDVLVIPGVANPTNIMQAIELGLDLVKFFPAEALGGISMLKAISAPFGHISFVPTGGINPENLSNYLMLNTVHACGGSWLTPRSLIRAGDFEGIKKLVKEGRKIVVDARAGK